MPHPWRLAVPAKHPCTSSDPSAKRPRRTHRAGDRFFQERAGTPDPPAFRAGTSAHRRAWRLFGYQTPSGRPRQDQPAGQPARAPWAARSKSRQPTEPRIRLPKRCRGRRPSCPGGDSAIARGAGRGGWDPSIQDGKAGSPPIRHAGTSRRLPARSSREASPGFRPRSGRHSGTPFRRGLRDEPPHEGKRAMRSCVRPRCRGRLPARRASTATSGRCRFGCGSDPSG